MARGGSGSIINMSSVAALRGLSSIVAYSAAKGAILSMTQQAIEMLPADYVGPDQIKAGQGKPEDVANLVLFLV